MSFINPFPDLKATHIPDWKKYLRRQTLLESWDTQRAKLPTNFPQKAESPSVWSWEELDLESVTHDLTSLEIEEIDEALRNFKKENILLNQISCENFSLPTLGRHLDRIAHEIFKGKGIASIRGLSPDMYSVKDNVIIHAGISSHIAPFRGNQSGSNDQVLHICNREDMGIADLKAPSTAQSLPFHTDDTDVLAFYAIEASMAGGEMLWASHGKVYNELAATRPEVLGVLAESDWPVETETEPSDYVRLPLLYNDDQGPYFWLARGNLTGTERTPRPLGIPGLTLAQADALDAVHFAAERHSIRIAPRKGELYFVNNLSILHSRTAFQDSDVKDEKHPRARRRHILRLWLRDPAYGRRMIGRLEQRWSQVFDTELSRKRGRWLLSRDMVPEVISEKLFREKFPVGTVSSCQNA
ncbi:uncharacterized protein F4807DRAFT_465960 [Annulohypoxylon truncatum]|uniref:uncharacterized protein n=1 Tax=Annulohypoxylon truncatum TaxID=327061 RepID=UPI002007E121|nr:uncharacterized protein F4807DRAFT_465960 [Annulohypoxylon truncatum]KAI1204160.1 hypothetical protein F4807DRAFT_465960 [Annulohypoxylon truncatum]